MAAIDLHLNGEGMLADVPREAVHHSTIPIRLGGLASGMQSGKPSVAIAVPLGDGTWALGETSLALLLTATEALVAVHGDPR